MLLAISNTLVVQATIIGDPSVTPSSNVESFTFNTKYITAGAGTFSTLNCDVGNNYTYVAIAGHNLGTIGATITIVNHDTTDFFEYAPIDDRVLFFEVPARSGGANDLQITITKPFASPTIITHIAAGQTTDLSSTSLSGQTVNTDYEAGYPRAPMLVSRKIQSTVNEVGAPTSVLIKSVSQKLKLNLNNVPTELAKTSLVTYQRFWINNGFFIQNDGEIDQAYMAFNFIPAAPKTHSQVRELVNLSYNFMGFNGQ